MSIIQSIRVNLDAKNRLYISKELYKVLHPIIGTNVGIYLDLHNNCVCLEKSNPGHIIEYSIIEANNCYKLQIPKDMYDYLKKASKKMNSSYIMIQRKKVRKLFSQYISKKF